VGVKKLEVNGFLGYVRKKRGGTKEKVEEWTVPYG